jgi:hypothetical protein
MKWRWTKAPRFGTGLSIAIVTPAGFLFKFYAGPLGWWFNNYGAGLLYEIFWILVVFFLFPSPRRVKWIPLWVFFGTSALEVMQLWHPWFLEWIRSYFLGSALIGTTFSWWDFPHYVLGCLIGWGWAFLLSREPARNA